MLSKIYTSGLIGIEGFDVCVETDIVNGMVSFELVGLPDTAVKEAKERVKSAIRNTGFAFPTKRIIMNMTPANKRKEGSGYDLSIAISILCSTLSPIPIITPQHNSIPAFFMFLQVFILSSYV